jgi:hypothetical protein
VRQVQERYWFINSVTDKKLTPSGSRNHACNTENRHPPEIDGPRCLCRAQTRRY